MREKSGGPMVVELEDDELSEVNGGVGISDVFGSDGCQFFFQAAGAGAGAMCANCFYFHRDTGGSTYCSHPHFGRY